MKESLIGKRTEIKEREGRNIAGKEWKGVEEEEGRRKWDGYKNGIEENRITRPLAWRIVTD